MAYQRFGKSKFDRSKAQTSNDSDSLGLYEKTAADQRLQQSLENDVIDKKYGFCRHKDAEEKIGWLLNMHPTEILNEDKRLISAVDYYFIQENGGRFKLSLPFQPYFFVVVKKEVLQDVFKFLSKKYAGYLSNIEIIKKEDLDLDNHLIGLKQTLIKMDFLTVNDLMKVRQPILSAVRRNREAKKQQSTYAQMLHSELENPEDELKKNHDHLQSIVDIREYDVPYHVRASIDLKIFVAHWYKVRAGNQLSIVKLEDKIIWPDCIVFAYDIETTKPPLKFPDSATDQIMMISYMVDGQGFLITNRQIVSEDVEDFEFTPRPEFEGPFTIFNEEDEMALLQRFFDHIIELKPHVFVTYNGDFFDWPFVEARAGFHGLNMYKEVGFQKDAAGVYTSRPAIHMDCLCWVKRDSYLPVGSQNLKAVAKAKLRYDPVELDPEDMCPMAAEQPQVLASYSVSDAVATYYLYMKYVHPFIFALCTIIPMEPDEVLRKGSGTLCEALLMVQAFHANIIFPNKQESILNKLSEDGRVLDQETYVGGHVEAIESGVFRADIPCRFRLVPDALQKLIDEADRTIKFTIEEEEKIDMKEVTNYEEVIEDIKSKLRSLRDNPCRLENPLIYHLDVGAMYPNIILTNRLQPSAMVNETVCAACSFNKPGATCQRQMSWIWRGVVMSATRGEFQMIQQQLENETFEPAFPNAPRRAFHQLRKDERAVEEKKRLTAYCKRAYPKVQTTRTEEKVETICQRENNFYVNTVLSFRDRRYEYKGLLKVAKKELSEAQKSGDISDIKEANAKAVLYDSLQLAHKCILNSFYGYVMRKGSRWFSMEMAGIVCYTGATIITKAREIVEQIGRPLELDTDGIWCILPGSFPESYVLKTTNAKKSKITISYPGAILNVMVKDQFTNHQYHDLVEPGSLEYSVRSENSIFFEVDGPYLSMILPASKEEGKKLKKRYAVFNFDGSLAELKGFEVKRRGELQLIKIFQSSVFDAFLKGDSLQSCYASTAKIADYWLDVLFTKGANMPDSELFDLISENRSMSRKLEEYGSQKSTSISTAKRLAEFLGDQMVKDAGLSCKFIISKKPDGAPVTERAIPLAIFQSEPSVKHHYLKRWLKDRSIKDFDIRNILDWNYYIERLSGTIMKIITIPAALQGIPNPVPRVHHPDWLQKRIFERTDPFKQRKITDLFAPAAPKPPSQRRNIDTQEDMFASQNTEDAGDIEDILQPKSLNKKVPSVSTVGKRKRTATDNQFVDEIHKSWRQVLGDPPPMGKTKEEILKWLSFQKQKWAFQKKQRETRNKRVRTGDSNSVGSGRVVRDNLSSNMGSFLQKTRRTLLDVPWQIIQIAKTGSAGLYRLWALVGQDLHLIKLVIPRIFYINHRIPKVESDSNVVWRKVVKTLPRSQLSQHLYEYTIPEDVFRENSTDLMEDLSTPEIEGIYETQVSLEFRALVQLGCLCVVDRSAVRAETDTFDLGQLKFKSTGQHKYLENNSMRHIFLYHHKCGTKAMLGLFIPVSKKAHIFVMDTVRSNQMPNMTHLYNNERTARIAQDGDELSAPESDYSFDIKSETDVRQTYRLIQKILQAYREEKRGPTFIAVQSPHKFSELSSLMPFLAEFPLLPIHKSDISTLYNVLDWQRVGAKTMVRHYLELGIILDRTFELARYLQVPAGNIPRDTTMFGADLMFARHLQKNNTVMWCSPGNVPDLGGHESDDNRLGAQIQESNQITEINHPGTYTNVCFELQIESLAVGSLLQTPTLNELEGTSSSTAFDSVPQTSLQDMIGGAETALTAYDETARCASSYRILRHMVAAWLKDVLNFKNEFADFQVFHFYRWLRDPNSLLYDPALKKILNNYMQKLFMHLISEFKRLGSTIVFANFNKIVLCTKRTHVPDAVSYLDYILQNIRNKELFHYLHITTTQTWQYLVWLDDANHGGVLSSSPSGESQKASQEQSNSEALEETTSEGAVIEMNWNLAEYLDEESGCKCHFEAIIGGFISCMYEKLQELGSHFSPGNSPVKGVVASSQSQSSQEVMTNDLISYSRAFVVGELSQKLFFVTQTIQKKGSSSFNQDTNESVSMITASGANEDPALTFVKSVCKVLSLDKNVTEQVIKLRRDLLKLLNIGEFAPEAEWKDPCVTFVLTEVICKVCNNCRNIDLCKDPNQCFTDGVQSWFCPSCKSTYDSREIESLLIDLVQKRSMAFVLQDLQCNRCSQIKQPNMTSYCDCGGRFQLLVKREELQQTMTVFFNIAKLYQLPFLKENVQWILTSNGW